MVIAGSTEALKEAKATAVRWTPAEAAKVFPSLSELGQECGYRIALLGGTFTRGDGGDLDCAMLPLRGVEQFQAAFVMRFGGRLVRHFRNRGTGIEHVHVLKGDRLYDFSFGVFWDLEEVRKWATRSKS